MVGVDIVTWSLMRENLKHFGTKNSDPQPLLKVDRRTMHVMSRQSMESKYSAKPVKIAVP